MRVLRHYNAFMGNEDVTTTVKQGRSARRRLAVAPWCLCFGLTLVWKAFVSPYALSGSFNSPLQVIVPLVVVVLWRSMSPLKNRLWIAWATGLIGTICSLVIGFGACESLSVPQILTVAASFLASSVYTMFYLLWSELYAEMDIARAGVAIAGSYLLGSALYFLLNPLGGSMCLGIAIALPMVSAGALVLGFHDVVAQPAPVLSGKASTTSSLRTILASKVFPWRVIVVVTAFFLAAGVCRSTTTTAHDLLSVGIAGVLVILLIAVSARLSAGVTVYRVYRIAFPIMMASLLVGVVMGGSSFVSKVIIGASQTISMITLVLFLCDSSHRFGMPAILLVSLARACTTAAFLLGHLLGYASALLLAEPYWEPAVYCVTIVIILTITYYWLSEPNSLAEFRNEEESLLPPCTCVNFDESSRPDDGAADPDAPIDSGEQASRIFQRYIESRSIELAGEYGLSKRETEVLVLLAWGKSAKRIEEILVVSPNTVKTHVRHIYSKLGIHSKAELDMLLFGKAD